MTRDKNERPEKLVIRPPSEWRSVLIRSTRGCNWNRCKFCGIYAALGDVGFSLRPVDDVLHDIEWYAQRDVAFTRAFIGDADPLCRDIEESVTICRTIRTSMPSVNRLTAYARAPTLFKAGTAALKRLADAGLSRVHAGLESGDIATLKFHRKGQTPKIVQEAVRKARDAGLEVSLYVLLGLGGADRWKAHIDATADLITSTDPDFVRIRRIWLYTGEDTPTGSNCPLWEDIKKGNFAPQSPEGTVHELARLVERVGDVRTWLSCDHANNYVQLEGYISRDRDRMRERINAFFVLPGQERMRHYAEVGSRL